MTPELVMLMKAQTEEREAERTERALEKEAWRAEAAKQASVIEGLTKILYCENFRAA